MNVPALAARAPLGETYTIVGTGASRRRGDDPLRGVEAAARRVDGDDQRRESLLGGRFTASSM